MVAAHARHVAPGRPIRRRRRPATAPFLVFKSALSRHDLGRFQRFVQARGIALEPASHVNGGAESARKSKISWLAPPEGVPCAESSDDDDDDDEPRRAPRWLFRNLRRCVAAAARAWPRVAAADLAYESVQLATYGVGGHYRQWHRDNDGVDDDAAPRAFSVVALLEACDAGGRFEVLLQRRGRRRRRRAARRWVRRPVHLRPGDAVAFPSATLWHRVSPVLAGHRASLVLWARERRGLDDAADDDDDDDDEWNAIQRRFESGAARDDFDDVA